jgi:hypothetical protein
MKKLALLSCRAAGAGAPDGPAAGQCAEDAGVAPAAQQVSACFGRRYCRWELDVCDHEEVCALPTVCCCYPCPGLTACTPVAALDRRRGARQRSRRSWSAWRWALALSLHGACMAR